MAKQEENIYEPIVKFGESTPDEIDEPDIKSAVEINKLVGLFGTYSAVPTGIPRKFSEQIRVVVTGGNASLYVYDSGNALWRSSTLIST